MDLRSLSPSDLTWQLVPLYSEKIAKKTVKDIMRPDRFTAPSAVSQRDFARIEQFFFDYFKEAEFIELSPLQPLGLNSVLAATDGKKALPTIRGQEVNSDATTALFLAAHQRYTEENLRVATHARTVRPKLFTEESKFLPHFKVFAEVSLGLQGTPFGARELSAIADHLFDELAVLQNIQSGLTPNRIKKLKVYLGDLALLRNLAKNPSATGHMVTKMAATWQALKLPQFLPIDDNLPDELRRLGFKKGVRVLEMFLEIFATQKEARERAGRTFVDVDFVFDLSRSAGGNYYRHLAYKIAAESSDGLELPLADGGSNDWGIKISGNKQIFTVSSGIGTELLIRNYFQPA